MGDFQVGVLINRMLIKKNNVYLLDKVSCADLVHEERRSIVYDI